VVAKIVLTLSMVGSLSYAAWNRRIDFANFGIRSPVVFSGFASFGRVIILIISLLSVGQMPDLRNADWILLSVKALSQDLLNLG
jgi:hypothetical protein